MPQEPSVVKTATELLGHLSNLQAEVDEIFTKIYGSRPQNECAANQQTPVLSLQDIVNIACTRVASLVGDARTINSRL